VNTKRKLDLRIYCDGGLGNRLNSLIGGLYLAKILNQNPIVSWPINRWCSAELHDLFESDLRVDKKTIAEFNEDKKKYLLITHAKQSFSANFIINPNNIFLSRSLVCQVEHRLNGCDEVLYHNTLVPIYVPIVFINEALNQIHIKEVYKDLANQFLSENKLKKGSYWGLHLRGTDVGFGTGYYKFWYLFSLLMPGQILLCTDDRSIEKKFLTNKSVVSRTKNAFPKKHDDVLGWNDACIDESGRQFNYNILRDRESIKESMIDFALLIESKIIPTSRSTFLVNAVRFQTKDRLLILLPRIIVGFRYLYRSSKGIVSAAKKIFNS
jgi:hypothetical protein